MDGEGRLFIQSRTRTLIDQSQSASNSGPLIQPVGRSAAFEREAKMALTDWGRIMPSASPRTDCF